MSNLLPLGILLTIFFGLTVGSFLNVCIYRIPRGGSVASPSRSYCPHCNHTLSALDNVPVFSYIFLRGKCRYCKGRISPRYIIVEILTMALFLLMLQRALALHQKPLIFAMELAVTFVFTGLLIAISFIDLNFFIIPNRLVYPGLILGLIFAIALAIIRNNFNLLLSKVLGGVIGAGIIIIIAIIGGLVFRKEAMGGGDVKLMGMIGIYLGAWPHIPITLIAGSLFGSIVGIVLIFFRKKKMDSRIPFGPFLAAGAIISLLYGNALWNWYRNLTGI